jgi:hypothetical protein
MTDAVQPAAAPIWRRLIARRRSRVLLALVLLAIAIRAVLPAMLRRVVVARADEAMVGRIEIDDVDLALLTGGFTLHGLRVFTAEAVPPGVGEPVAADATAPRAGEGPPGSAPVLSAGLLTVDLGFLAFLRKTVEVQRIELADVAVSLDRAKDGTLLLPAAVPATEPEPPAEGPGWGVLIQSVALRNGRIGFRDFAIGDPPQRVEVALPTLDAAQLALLITESGVAPGKVFLDAGIQDGSLHLEAALESLPGGPAYESHVVLTNVPIADSRLYIPKVGWSGLTGHLDANLVHRFESQGAHTVRGTVGLRDLDVRVAGLDDPALAWRALSIDVAGIDFVAQHADVTTVSLDGARVVTRPAGPEPLPVLHGLFAAAAEQVGAVPVQHAPPPRPSPSPAVTAVAATPSATGATPPTGATTMAAAAPSATVDSTKPWTWAIGKVRVNDGNVHLIGGDGPLDVAVTAEVAPLVSAAGKAATVRLDLTSSAGGTLELVGDLTPTPLAFDGTLTAKDLRLAPLTQPIATAPTRLLKNGVANLDLAIAAGATSKAPTDGVLVSGTIALNDIDVAGEDPAAFAVRWKQLAVALRSVTAPGVLAAGGAPTSGPIDAAFGSIALVRPEIVVTRTAAGLALPAALGGEHAPAPTAAAAPAARSTPSTAAQASTAAQPIAPQTRPDVQVRADRLTLEKMRVVANDTAVKPYYRSTLDPIDLSAVDVVWPGPAAKDVKLVAKNVDGGILTVTGNVAPARTRLVAKLAELPLSPFNPYAASTGYGVAGGTAQLESTITLGKGTYDTKSRIVLHGLDVRGGEGDAFFTSKFGMPLSLALSLLTDLQGNIVLDLPIAGDATGMRTGLGTLIGNALARAILNAVTSPLKLIGAVASIGDKPASLTPQPIAFLVGRADLAAGEDQKLAPLASLLAKAPGLRLHLRGTAGDQDRRWLREQALRAKLEQESGGFGAIRHIGERGARRDALAALTARAAGTPAEIPAEHQTWFETQVAAQSVDDSALQQLATARATAVRAKLASGQGVDAERVIIDDPPAIDPAASPAVVVGLGSPAP